ncbi:MAG: hypothetical protein Alpg2KO_16930 [Alphaproteobacteria bacterium]
MDEDLWKVEEVAMGKPDKTGTIKSAQDRGASLLTYGLLVGLISTVALVAVTSPGENTESLFVNVSDSLSGVGGGSGSAGAGAPAPSPDLDCTHPELGAISHGSDVTAWEAATVPFGESCNSETRSCSSSVLSGSFEFATCAVNSAPSGTFSFTTCGASGASGPDQSACDSSYSGSDLDGDVTVTAGFQFWTVPATGNWTFDVRGAQGGYGRDSNPPGGRGARIVATLSLSAGDQLKIVVGQYGGDYGNSGGGGGGGSFVALADNTPLVVAGGGGGGADNNGGGNGNATLTSIGNSGGGGGNNTAYAGAGFTGDGGGGARAFTSTASGGTSTNNGGFGGGGRGVNDSDGIVEDHGGGGGGYRGGDGRAFTSGLGGLSFVNTSFGSASTNTSGNNSGDGSVTITFSP